ncbi:hypothetical protein K9N50_06715 [bacterium]|nr:hypothetical protein [bacterium]
MIGIILFFSMLNLTDINIPSGIYERNIQSISSDISLSNFETGVTKLASLDNTYKQVQFLNSESMWRNHAMARMTPFEKQSSCTGGIEPTLASEDESKDNIFSDWGKPCLITAGIGLTFYGLYTIRGH